MENGKWKWKNGKWKNGKWKMENGKGLGKGLEMYVYECVTMYSLYKFT